MTDPSPSPEAARRRRLRPVACGPATPQGAVDLRLFDAAPGLVALLRVPSLVVEYANAACETLAGQGPLRGRAVTDLWPALGAPAAAAWLAQLAAGACQHREQGREVRVRHADGRTTLHVLDLHIVSVRAADGSTRHLLLQGQDVSATRSLDRALQYARTRDPLTGLVHASQFLLDLDQAIAVAGARGAGLVVLAVDLDRFKRVNAAWGRAAGDGVLAQLAGRLAAAVPEALVGRSTGDQFLVLCDASVSGGMAGLSGRVARAVAAPLAGPDGDLYLSCSIGAAAYPEHGPNAEHVLAAAERALHQAQEEQGVRRPDPAPAPGLLRLALGGGLRAALAGEALELHFQPQIELAQGRIAGVEALVRWRGPGAVPTPTLIALAEDTGLIVELGHWVLRRACLQAQAWRAAGLGALRVAVNVSARQLTSGVLPRQVAAALDETGLPPACLDLELTESLLMADLDAARATLSELKRLGVMLSLDDFGTGYSSLAYLHRLPLDVLKIDRAFLAQVPQAAPDCAIVRTIVGLGRGLGLRVISEGVERADQCRFLAQLGCDEVQGHLFAPALPAAAVTILLRDGIVVPAAERP